MTNNIHHAKAQLKAAIEQDNLSDFQRYCTRYTLNTDLDIPGLSFATPLIYSSRLGSSTILDYVLSSKNITLKCQDNYGQDALMNSIYSGNPEVFRKLSRNFDTNTKDHEENTCLHLAASTGNLEILKICIEEYGLKDLPNRTGIRPLHLAESPEIIEYLIVQNFDVNLQDQNGWSPLHYNLYLNRAENVKILLQIGADVKVVEKTGASLIEFAKKHAPELAGLIEAENERLKKSQENSKHNFLEIAQKREESFSQMVEVRSENSSFSEASSPAKMMKRTSSTESANLQLTPKIQMMLSEILMKTPSDAFSLQDFGVEEIRFSELKIREVLGQGAYGKVHRGYFRGTEVAIKIIDTEKTVDDRLAKEFIKEIECLLKIRHSRFLLLLAVCLENPLCIVTEISKGGNLGAAIEKKQLNHSEKLRVALQIAEGIHYIHSKTPPIVHRDIKPQNILLDEFGQVKIADLGLSRAIEKVSNTEKINSTRICAGTVRYMAPELYYEEPICTRATDVWAYGCVLLHLFNENVPWTGLDLVAVQRRLILKHPLPIDLQDEAIKKIVKSCCELQPDDRINFSEIRGRLMDIMGVSSSQM